MKCLIVDDHAMIRNGIRSVLERSDLHSEYMIYEAASVDEAFKLLKHNQMDLVVVDHVLQNQTGLNLLEKVETLSAYPKFLVLTQSQDTAVLSRYVQWGVESIVLKENSEEEFLNAYRTVQSGQTYFSPAIQALLDGEDDALLTAREQEVVALVALGKSNKQVATDLSCSVETVKTHKANIMRKLGVTNSIEIALWAIKKGLA